VLHKHVFQVMVVPLNNIPWRPNRTVSTFNVHIHILTYKQSMIS